MSKEQDIVKAASHEIMLCLQLRDFGHVVDDQYVTNIGKTEEFIAACDLAAANVIAAIRPQIEAEERERCAKVCEAYLTPARRAQLAYGLGVLFSPERAFDIAGKSHASAIRALDQPPKPPLPEDDDVALPDR